jgi:hypothetical protein
VLVQLQVDQVLRILDVLVQGLEPRGGLCVVFCVVDVFSIGAVFVVGEELVVVVFVFVLFWFVLICVLV